MKKNNKFSIRKYSIGVVSVIIGLFILAGANADDRYMQTMKVDLHRQ